MDRFKIFNKNQKLSGGEREEIASFLHRELEEFGDPKSQIKECLDYSMGESASSGGFTLAYYQEKQLLGVVVVNRTGMAGYIPENLLVYIATDKERRGEGIGKKLMRRAIGLTEGDIALHVEPHNPARFLYEKLGFTSKYLEMRLVKEEK